MPLTLLPGPPDSKSYLHLWLLKAKAENLIGAKCESRGKVKSYWRPLGFCIFFYQSSQWHQKSSFACICYPTVQYNLA